MKKCNCGRDVRYTHIVDGKEFWSCNKHILCPTYDELIEEVRNGRLELAKSNKKLKTLIDVMKYNL